MLETFYQWDRPFLVDDSRFRARFPEVGVDLDTAVAETARVGAGTASTTNPTPAHEPAPAR